MPRCLPEAVLDRHSQNAVPSSTLRQHHCDVRAHLLERAAYLDPPERQLLNLVYALEIPVRRVARLRKVSHGALCRQINTLRKRLTTPLVVAVLDDTCILDDFDRQLALDHWLKNHSVRRLCLEHHLARSDVQRRLQFVKGWFDGRKEGIRLAKTLSLASEV